MSVACRHCGALFWKNENKWCCCNGRVKFEQEDLPPQVPDLLLELLSTNSPEASRFRSNIRQYNAALAVTSMGTAETMIKGASEGKGKVAGGWPYTFKVHGELRHL